MRIENTTAGFGRARRLLFLIAFLWQCVCASFANEVGKPARAQEPTAEDTRCGSSHLPAMRLQGNYFSHDGCRFIPVGANWVPAKAAMQMAHAMGPKGG